MLEAVRSFFASFAGQLSVVAALAAAAGSALTFFLMKRARSLTVEKAERVFGVLEDHKDELIFLIGTLVILARSVIVPHAEWSGLLGDLIYLVLAAGLGLGFARAGRGLERKDSPSKGSSASKPSNDDGSS